MINFTFFVDGEPKAQQRPRAFVAKFGGRPMARVYNPSTAEGWKSAVAMAAKPYLPPQPLAGPVGLTLTFYFPRPKAHFRSNGELKASAPSFHTQKPDRDNLDKAVMDALKHIGFLKDDSVVCAGNIWKFWADFGHPGCEIVIWEIVEPPGGTIGMQKRRVAADDEQHRFMMGL